MWDRIWDWLINPLVKLILIIDDALAWEAEENGEVPSHD